MSFTNTISVSSIHTSPSWSRSHQNRQQQSHASLHIIIVTFPSRLYPKSIFSLATVSQVMERWCSVELPYSGCLVNQVDDSVPADGVCFSSPEEQVRYRGPSPSLHLLQNLESSFNETDVSSSKMDLFLFCTVKSVKKKKKSFRVNSGTRLGYIIILVFFLSLYCRSLRQLQNTWRENSV